jgi:spore coat polysaccharide biosynthesis predicted glycosyltransferase SpsG
MKITDQQLLELEKTDIPLIFIDDEKRRNIISKGFVIDWTVLSDEKNYFTPKKDDIVYLLGSKYTPLRELFKDAKKNKIKDEIETIMITFGGADVRDLTPDILKTISKHFPKITKNIVIGGGFTNIKKIEKYKDKNTNLIFNADTSTMIELMNCSDLAIASGGQTLYELARIGTPTIAILLVENAKDDTQGWEKVGSLVNIGWWDDKNLFDNLLNAISKLKNKSKRLDMQKKAINYISPNGAEILVEEILKKL